MGKIKKVITRVEDSIHFAFKAACHREGTTMSEVLKNCMKNYIKKSKKA